jgi:hypothetical protein
MDAKQLAHLRRQAEQRALHKGVMPMNQERAILHYLQGVYDKDVIITRSYLSNAVIQANGTSTQSINFNFQQTNQKAGTGSNSPIDNLLNMVDTFEVTGFRLALFTLPASGSPLTVTSNYGNAVKHYYPNPNVFTGTTGSVEYLNLMNIFNALMFVKIDSTVFFESMQVADLMKVGITEQGTALSTVANTGIARFTSGDVRHIEMDCTPMFMLNGSGKNDIQINLFEGANLGCTDASPARLNFVELQLLGFLCQGGAKQGVKKA